MNAHPERRGFYLRFCARAFIVVTLTSTPSIAEVLSGHQKVKIRVGLWVTQSREAANTVAVSTAGWLWNSLDEAAWENRALCSNSVVSWRSLENNNVQGMSVSGKMLSESLALFLCQDQFRSKGCLCDRSTGSKASLVSKFVCREALALFGSKGRWAPTWPAHHWSWVLLGLGAL